MVYKAAHQCIKPEDVIPFNKYTFSYNPEEQPSVQRFYSIRLNEMESWSQKIYDVFDSLKYSRIDTYVEISGSGRLHFHGYIRIYDIPNFYFYDLKKLKHYGTYEIDFITDPLKWDLYCKKQKDFMDQFCSKNGIIYHYTKSDIARLGHPVSSGGV